MVDAEHRGGLRLRRSNRRDAIQAGSKPCMIKGRGQERPERLDKPGKARKGQERPEQGQRARERQREGREKSGQREGRERPGEAMRVEESR